SSDRWILVGRLKIPRAYVQSIVIVYVLEASLQSPPPKYRRLFHLLKTACSSTAFTSTIDRANCYTECKNCNYNCNSRMTRSNKEPEK
ncbi:MAG: hypothetical protein NC489_38365, partial [Ruminococcus flavefaciens]|nr:hypothetical protein [Ruminococcus flavefaciens]